MGKVLSVIVVTSKGSDVFHTMLKVKGTEAPGTAPTDAFFKLQLYLRLQGIGCCMQPWSSLNLSPGKALRADR
jgi:hypothetical protein